MDEASLSYIVNTDKPKEESIDSETLKNKQKEHFKQYTLQQGNVIITGDISNSTVNIIMPSFNQSDQCCEVPVSSPKYQVEIASLSKEFTKTLDNIEDAIEEDGKSLRFLRRAKLLTKDDKPLIPGAEATKTVGGLFQLITDQRFWSWFDIGLLNDLLDGGPCEKASLIFNDYKKMLRDNVKTRLKVAKEAPVNTEGMWIKLKEERDHTNVTLEVLLKHKEHLMKHFGIPADVLTFSHAYKGCVTTCWYITSEAAATTIKEKLLQDGGIEENLREEEFQKSPRMKKAEKQEKQSTTENSSNSTINITGPSFNQSDIIAMENKSSSTDPKSSHSSATNSTTAQERSTSPNLPDSSELVRKTSKGLNYSMKRENETFDCIKNGDKLMIQELIYKSNVNSVIHATSSTPLHVAVQHNHLDIVLYLLELGADVHVKDNDHRVPLHYAKGEVTKVLLEHGSQVDPVDLFGQTPLHWAVKRGDAEACQLLLKHKADVNKKDKKNKIPLQYAETVQVTNVLLEHGSQVDPVDSYGQTPLHWAVKRGDAEACQLLLKHKADVNKKDKRNKIPLQYAVTVGVTKVLLEHGSHVDLVDSYRQTPLHKAAERGDAVTCQLLLKHKADVNKNDHENKIPLQYAKTVQVTKVLLKHGSQVDPVDSDGQTPLHKAAVRGDAETCQLLLIHKADVNKKDNENKIPLQYAKSVQVTNVLLEHGSQVDPVDSYGQTPLHKAAERGDAVTCQLLLKHKADVNKKDNENKIPLQYAKTVQVTKVLLEHGSQVDPVDSDGRTPLHKAAARGDAETCELLIQHNADVNKKDLEGRTPEERASESFKKTFWKSQAVTPTTNMPEEESENDFRLESTIMKEEPIVQSTLNTDTTTNPTWIEDYKKAIDKRGSVIVKVVRAIFCGSPEVGKSSLKYNLVYGKSKEVKISTGVAESPEVVIATNYLATGSDADWIPVDEEVMETLVRICTNQGDYEEHSTYPTPSSPPDEDPEVEAISSPQVTPSPLPISESTQDRPVTPTSVPVGLADNAQEDSTVAPQVKRLQDIRDEVLGNQDLSDLNLKEATFIHFLDSGGQPSFQDSLPFLFTMPCTYIQVFNASEDLKEAANMTFRSQDGHTYKLPQNHGLTSIDLMLRSFSSIYTAASKPIDPRIKDILRSQPELQIFLVGTFKDKLFSFLREDREARLESIITQLNQLEGKPYHSFIVKNDVPSRHTLADSLKDSHDLPESVSWPFIINNMMSKDGPPSEEDLATLKALRSKILSSSKKGSTNGFELDMPLTWFLLYVITHKYEHKFIQYDDLKEFCIQSSYLDHEDADRQFEGMLTLFHMLGFYAFFDHTETSREWICTDITALYGEFANLLTVHFKDPLYFDSDAARLFHCSGIIRQADFEELFNELGINEAIPKKWLLEVIHHLGLAAKYQSDPEEYFMPLVLPYGKVKVPEDGSVENLCFAFKYLGSRGRIDLLDLPRGIFCHLVVQLSEQAKGSNLKPQTANCDQTTAAFISGGLNVYLMEKPGRLELQVECSSLFYPEKSPSDRYPELHERCKEIRYIVHSAIQEICSKMMDGMPPDKKPQLEVGFLCRCDSTKPAHLALVEEGKAKECLVCQLEKRRPFDEEARIWFEPVSKGQSDAAVGSSTKEKIRTFLSSEDFMDHFYASCDVRRIAPRLRQSEVLERGDLQKMAPDVDLTSANTNLYILLDNDPSLAKLTALSEALREDHTHGCHEELADRIDQFIATI